MLQREQQKNIIPFPLYLVAACLVLLIMCLPTVGYMGSASVPGPLTDTTVMAATPAAWRVLAGPGTAPGKLTAPTYLAVDKQGNVYVSDTGNHRIQKLSPEGELMAQWGSGGSEPGHFGFPVGIAIDAKGNIYVAESANSRIQNLPAQLEERKKDGFF